MKACSMKYSHSSMNLGDTIQSLAAEQFLPRVDVRIERDELNCVPRDETYLVIMNGFFEPAPGNWPPSDSVCPVFFGFHMADKENVHDAMLSDESIRYFRCHQPIGCRDQITASLLREKGVDTYYSKCLTLTFPRRTSEPENGRIYIVDADEAPVSRQLAVQAIRLSHDVPHWLSDEQKRRLAQDRLDLYRTTASMVITTKLHCALPCIAMGIPVIFFGDPDEYRVSIIKDMGVPIHELPGKIIRRRYRLLRHALKYQEAGFVRRHIMSWVLLAYCRASCYSRVIFRKISGSAHIDWSPKAVDFEQEKAEIIKGITVRIRHALGGDEAVSIGRGGRRRRLGHSLQAMSER